jgi:uncharacterized protein YxjI
MGYQRSRGRSDAKQRVFPLSNEVVKKVTNFFDKHYHYKSDADMISHLKEEWSEYQATNSADEAADMCLILVGGELVPTRLAIELAPLALLTVKKLSFRREKFGVLRKRFLTPNERAKCEIAEAAVVRETLYMLKGEYNIANLIERTSQVTKAILRRSKR